MIEAPKPSTFAHPAVIATKPAREPFKHMDTSGLPYLTHVTIITVTVANAGANVVVAKICAILVTSAAAAPLNPYHPNHKMKHPRAPIVILCPGIAFGLPSLPNLPIRGPRKAAPMIAVTPPTI